MKLFNQIATLH